MTDGNALRPVEDILGPLLLSLCWRVARNGATPEARRLALMEIARRAPIQEAA
jgi:hypothetical protein